MPTSETSGSRLRTRWSAIGAAIAVTLGAGGIGFAQAAGDSGDQPVTVTVDAERILDTRIDLGLTGPFVQDTPRDVQVTGAVDVATDTGTDTKTVVPDGATAVLVNVTVVFPTDQGFLTLRSADASGAPSTSTVNFQAGSVEPNAATVDLSADGKLQVWVFMPDAAATADVLIDVVGYTVDHDHDDRYYTQDQVDAEIDAAVEAAIVDPVVPSGTTITGVFSIVDHAEFAYDWYPQVVNLRARATTALTDATVNIAPSPFSSVADEDASCTGTALAPTAPAGKVCIYPDASTSFNVTISRGAHVSVLPEQAFSIHTYPETAGAFQLGGTWAYTAP